MTGKIPLRGQYCRHCSKCYLVSLFMSLNMYSPTGMVEYLFKSHKKNLKLAFGSTHRKCSLKKVVCKNFAKLKLQLKLNCKLKLKFWISRNFYKHLFYRAPPGNCFWTFVKNVFESIWNYPHFIQGVRYRTLSGLEISFNDLN